MTSADSLSLILRRLDEIERKLDRMMEELRPHCHRLFGTQGQSSKKGLKVGWFEMVKSLMAWRPHLSKSKEDREAIAYAMRNYGPTKNSLTDYADYHVAATDGQRLFWLDRKVVIAALLKAEADRLSRPSLLVPFSAGAFAALATKLQSKRPKGKPKG